MKVFITAHEGKNRYRMTFHKKASCYNLSNGAKELDADELPAYAKPCACCFPDWVKPESLHKRCQICCPQGRIVPCQHNGGVLVSTIKKHLKQTWTSEKGEEYLVRHYVWPEHAHRYLV